MQILGRSTNRVYERRNIALGYAEAVSFTERQTSVTDQQERYQR
jgi:hypothetical protein